ncbi:MAG: SPOR domain-containing protein, partial [Thiothrix sp.]|nr:SPOR domain-containing protein [Thiothrix sp.]HPE61191.1 SPOR domain-containing protein [Thiolinea sp.]
MKTTGLHRQLPVLSAILAVLSLSACTPQTGMNTSMNTTPLMPPNLQPQIAYPQGYPSTAYPTGYPTGVAGSTGIAGTVAGALTNAMTGMPVTGTPTGSNVTTTGTSGHVVQLLASNSQAKAEAARILMMQAGYNAFVNTVNSNGTTLYRVQVGPYASKDEAGNVLNQMRTTLAANPYVAQAFVNQNP